MKINYISKNAVIEINRQATFRYNQVHVLIAEANLEHALDATERYGENIADAEEKLLKKAAYLLYHLAYDCHAFADGNKRTALLATAAYLGMNDYAIVVNNEDDQEEMAKLMKDAAEGKRSINAVYRWVRKSIRKFEDGN